MSFLCDYGLRLDSTGCPLNGICECKSVCDNFECVRDSEICISKNLATNCGIEKPCPPIPICIYFLCLTNIFIYFTKLTGIPNPCMNSKIKTKKITQLCSKKSNCANNEKCKITEVENENIGICCSNEASNESDKNTFNVVDIANEPNLSHKKIGICPSTLTPSLLASNDSISKQRILFDERSKL